VEARRRIVGGHDIISRHKEPQAQARRRHKRCLLCNVTYVKPRPETAVKQYTTSGQLLSWTGKIIHVGHTKKAVY